MDTVLGMRTFVAVARQASFTSGARQLGISTKVASKYVRQLEESLGVQLLHRTTRKVTLTDTGQAYLQRCIPLLDQFDELESVVQERQATLAGPIRITAPTAFGSAELIEALCPFQTAHPKVEIRLFLSDQRVSIVEEGFDLGIRFGTLQDSTLIARKLSDMRVAVFASPDYLERHGEPAHPSALTTHNCLLALSSADATHWRFRINGEALSVPVAGSFHANAPRAVAHMAAGGLGIGIAPIYVAQPFIETGRLKVLFEEYEASAMPLHAIYPQNRHLVARVRALIDHLAKAFSG